MDRPEVLMRAGPPKGEWWFRTAARAAPSLPLCLTDVEREQAEHDRDTYLWTPPPIDLPYRTHPLHVLNYEAEHHFQALR